MPIFRSSNEGHRGRGSSSVWGSLSLSSTPPSPGMPLLTPTHLRPPPFTGGSAGDLSTVTEAVDNLRTSSSLSHPAEPSVNITSQREAILSPSGGSRFRIVGEASEPLSPASPGAFGASSGSSDPSSPGAHARSQGAERESLGDRTEVGGLSVPLSLTSSLRLSSGEVDSAEDPDTEVAGDSPAAGYPMIASSLTASYPMLSSPTSVSEDLGVSEALGSEAEGLRDLAPALGLPLQEQPAQGIPAPTPRFPAAISTMATPAFGAEAAALVASDDANAELGLPTVLGVPVGIADSPLPDNCCEQKCRCIDWSPSIRFRRIALITSFFLSFFVVLLGVGADILGSEWGMRSYFEGEEVVRADDMPNYARYYQENGFPGSGDVRIPAEYVAFCQLHGQAPTRGPLVISFIVASIVFTLGGTLHYIIIARGCSLCCAPCLNDDKTCRTNTLLAFAFIFLGASSLGHFWMLVMTTLDVSNCESCYRSSNHDRVASAKECARGFHLQYLHWGISTSSGVCSAIAVHLAGRFCQMVNPEP